MDSATKLKSSKDMGALSYRFATVVIGLLLLGAAPAQAELSTDALTDAVLQKFQASAARWEPAIAAAAGSLFWKLALVSLVVTFGLLLVRRAELGEIAAELVRYSLFTGFWYWILQNGPTFFQAIVRSLWQLGGQASGAAQGLSVSKILDLALRIYHMDAGQMNILNMGNSMLACAMGILVLILGTIMAANVILVMCSAWIVAFGGAIVLGFGGSRWTSDIAVAYLRAALAIGLKVMTLALVIGLGIDFLQGIIGQAGTTPKVGDLALLTIAMGILTILAVILPGTVASLATGGGHAGHGVGALGVGAAWTAAQLAGRSAMGGASAGSGGAHALREAIRSAESSVNGSGGNRNGSGGSQGESANGGQANNSSRGNPAMRS